MVALVIAEHNDSALRPTMLNVIAAAAACSGEVHVLVAGEGCAAAAQDAATVEGVSKVLLAEGAQFAGGLAENIAAQVLAISGEYSHILAPATPFGKNILPRVAAKLDVSQVSEITRVVSADTFERPIYAGSAIATVRSKDAIKVITVRTTSFAAQGKSAAAAPIEASAPISVSTRARLVSKESLATDRPDLTAAKIVVAGGRGLASRENFEQQLAPLATKLHAAVGASRAAVDAGYAANDCQVGQTGKVVAPQLYIAVGISGAIQHLAGMKDSKVIVAINKDPDAPIFSIADYGLVGDLNEVLPQFTAGL
ncbi:electron transfer flavoprotein subunit alpha/FixB family protein [Aromatoleum toluvorans]|uniref:Electron transfer flavoprotein subunit alpha/FixB family protein n=1 Tax=Aromatoleum toluvorans TaxID=92002 RepID=A0ABX1Q462_9RHOO|nr:FAD-binding protein [Aromatoleum toluvorans]NMG46148.1 electron transfer flavoprotein subunit alpha/FixB family protein [Aromatoleum toluvorans]